MNIKLTNTDKIAILAYDMDSITGKADLDLAVKARDTSFALQNYMNAIRSIVKYDHITQVASYLDLSDDKVKKAIVLVADYYRSLLVAALEEHDALHNLD